MPEQGAGVAVLPFLLEPGDRRPVHFMGIAGAGMSGLAELLVRRGVAVTGCDTTITGARDLQALGVPLFADHAPEHLTGVRAVVVTSAVPGQHPELEAARALGIPVVRRAEALGAVVNSGRVVAVAGTHGKTTTTVMATDALTAAGLNPTGIVGGRVREWGGNLRYGGDDVFVVEADEYDRSFLALRPTVAVVTNVEADHLDIYRDLDDIRATFVRFASNAHTVVVCDDDEGAATLPLTGSAQQIRYGLTSATARMQGRVQPLRDGRSALAVTWDGECLGDVVLRVPGDHNARNALAALSAGFALGAEFAQMREGLESFRGVERRFERVGSVAGIEVVDDYAHHPTEVAATLHAARATFPGRRIVVAFQPHLYSRTRDFASQFAESLAAADLCFLADVYPAREQPIAGVSSQLIADPLARAGRSPVWRGARSELAAALALRLKAGDVVLTVGAGDITKTGPELLARLTKSAP